jgi:hypothetical protein
MRDKGAEKKLIARGSKKIQDYFKKQTFPSLSAMYVITCVFCFLYKCGLIVDVLSNSSVRSK